MRHIHSRYSLGTGRARPGVRVSTFVARACVGVRTDAVFALGLEDGERDSLSALGAQPAVGGLAPDVGGAGGDAGRGVVLEDGDGGEGAAPGRLLAAVPVDQGRQGGVRRDRW